MLRNVNVSSKKSMLERLRNDFRFLQIGCVVVLCPFIKAISYLPYLKLSL